MGKSCSKIILLILILAAWIVVTVRAKKTEEGIILTDAYKKQIMESAEWKKIFLHTENYPDIVVEKGTVDELIAMMIGGNEL